MVFTAPTENTHLLNSDARHEHERSTSRAALPKALGRPEKKAMTSLFVVNILVQFARNIGMTSKVQLIRSLACAEHYGLRPSAGSQDVNCLVESVDARTSKVIAYIVSSNYLSSCFFALVLSPLLVKQLGYRGCMVLGTALVSLHLCFPFLVAEHTRLAPKSPAFASGHVTPTLALHMLVAESLISGILGSPDILFEFVSRAIVIDSVPASSRSTWLAWLKASIAVGGVAASLVLQPLRLDTRSDLLVDLLPLKLGAAVSVFAFLASFTVSSLTNRNHPSPTQSGADTGERVVEAERRGTLSKLRLSLLEACRPLLLVVKPIRHQTTAKSDWSLSRVIFAYMLTNQIGIATSTFVVYCPSRFGLHAKELSLMMGWLSAFVFVWLAFAFPVIAKWTRERFERLHQTCPNEHDGTVTEQEDYAGSAASERFLSINTLLLDSASWLVLAAAGSVANFPFFLFGLALFCIACPSESTLAALASILCPGGTPAEDLSAALSLLNSVMCTICPMLCSWIYAAGLHVHVPELVFIFTSVISTIACILVATIHLPRSIPASREL